MLYNFDFYNENIVTVHQSNKNENILCDDNDKMEIEDDTDEAFFQRKQQTINDKKQEAISLLYLKMQNDPLNTILHLVQNKCVLRYIYEILNNPDYVNELNAIEDDLIKGTIIFHTNYNLPIWNTGSIDAATLLSNKKFQRLFFKSMYNNGRSRFLLFEIENLLDEKKFSQYILNIFYKFKVFQDTITILMMKQNIQLFLMSNEVIDIELSYSNFKNKKKYEAIKEIEKKYLELTKNVLYPLKRKLNAYRPNVCSSDSTSLLAQFSHSVHRLHYTVKNTTSSFKKTNNARLKQYEKISTSINNEMLSVIAVFSLEQDKKMLKILFKSIDESCANLYNELLSLLNNELYDNTIWDTDTLLFLFNQTYEKYKDFTKRIENELFINTLQSRQNKGLSFNELCQLAPSQNKNNQECSICIGAEKENDDCYTALSCKHVFHDVCIKEWLKDQVTCPYCREPQKKI